MLKPGERIGTYDVVAVIGVGGMGEVYRAHDTRLGRDVAIKVLPEAMLDRPSRLVRFEREARALAAMNHPNIATVYGIEETLAGSGSASAIVMEFVDGVDLSTRLRRGPMALADVLDVASQVVDALAAAHDAGIVHRDLKPGNIKIREDGTVKVLDFGLAKSGRQADDAPVIADATSASGSGASLEGLPPTQTLAPDVTRDGAVVGTAAYMAPEQAKGKPVDKRVDIWAFGVVLFEMLAGRRPFAAGDAADTMARVLATDPDWSLLPRGTPDAIQRLLQRCLAKDRRDRLHDIADARLEIKDARTTQAPRPRQRSSMAVWVVTALLSVLIGAVGGRWWGASRNEPAPVIYAQIDVAPAEEINSGGVHPSVVLPPAGAVTALAWSPDGRTLAFIGVKDGVRQIFARDVSAASARALTGTEGAHGLAFSPDGNEIAFWDDTTIRRVKVAGGPTAKIRSGKAIAGVAWGASGIVYAESPDLYVMPPSGADRRRLTFPPDLVRHSAPIVLPGGAAIVFTEHGQQWTSGDERLMVMSLAQGATPRVLLREAADARYLAPGSLAFMRQGTLFVVPFDPVSLQLRGEPQAVVKDIVQSVNAWDSDDLTLHGQFAVSPQGTLGYVAGAQPSYPDGEIVRIDRRGRAESIGAPVAGYRSHIEVSPDGTKIAASIQTATGLHLFLYDRLLGGLSRIAESMKGEVLVSSWSRADQIAVQVVEGGHVVAALVRPDVTSPVVTVQGSNGWWAGPLSEDGHLAAMGGIGLAVFSPRTPAAPEQMQASSTTAETQPAWSPDGRWLAYTSTTTGRSEVYVRPFPGPGNAIMLSSNGGSGAAWNPRGGELFYVEPGDSADRMMAMRFVSASDREKSRPLFAIPHTSLYRGTPLLTPYAVAPDGQSFYGVRPVSRPRTPVSQISLIFNWLETVRPR